MKKNAEERTITLSEKTLDRLVKAKRDGESFSDVVNRLSETKVTALQQRGEKEIMTSDERKLFVRIDQSKCAGGRVVSQLRLQYFPWIQVSWGGEGKVQNRLGSRM